jgi:hypothetical protein
VAAVTRIGGFLFVSGLVHRTPASDALPRPAQSGNGPTPNFWAVGFALTYYTILIAPLVFSLLSHIDTIRLTHARPL